MGISPLLDLLGELGDQHGYSPGEEAEHAFDQAKEGRFVRPERLQEQGRVQVLSDGRGEGAH